eukprot:1236428-Prymnesium_polylepis.1
MKEISMTSARNLPLAQAETQCSPEIFAWGRAECVRDVREISNHERVLSTGGQLEARKSSGSNASCTYLRTSSVRPL